MKTPLQTNTSPGLLWPGVLTLGYLLAIIVGVILIRSPIAMPAGSELSFPRSVFTICNAATLTGFQQTIAVEKYNPAGQYVIFAMIVSGSLVSLIVGGAAVARLLALPHSMLRIIMAAVIVEIGAVALGTAALLSPERPVFVAIFQAVSAFGNCGIVIGPPPGMNDLVTHLFVIPLSVLGGLGLPVLLEIFDWIREGRSLSFHSRAVLVLAGGVFLGGTLLLTLFQVFSTPPNGARQSFIQAAVTTLNSRSLGWAMQSSVQWPRAMQWAVMLLMMIGAAPAGTGGGIKTTSLVALWRGTASTLRGQVAGRIFGIALVWLALYLLIVTITTARLLQSESMITADQLVFIANSAVGNVGLSPSPISITGGGLHTLSAAMLLGRIMPLVVLWWAALTTRDAELAIA